MSQRSSSRPSYTLDRVLDYCRVELQQPCFLDHHPIAIFKLAARFEMTDVKDKASRRLVELHDPMEEALRQDLVGVTAGELASWYDMRKRRMNAVTNAVQRHLSCLNAKTPTDRFRQRVNMLLLENLTASAIDRWSIIDTTYTDYCSGSCCSGRKLSSRLSALQDELGNPDVFFGTRRLRMTMALVSGRGMRKPRRSSQAIGTVSGRYSRSL
ncbi:hypothetical protein CALVIDRAFT_183553 [Calocera viscosa TUFC12733]|uniref:Uncharacterized protein n=1 Tax=Calocera viscosa (strain TUFC12733) TaxID=1330018 RepID=A0A167L2D2_CALVF|nr:hypothetical protein CALVIDRAFT_183553 [Calocera viscosa TUFC12733]